MSSGTQPKAPTPGMAALSGRRQHADEVLAQEYGSLRGRVTATVRASLARRNIHFDAADVEAFYNQAWHGLHTELTDGRAIANRPGWLVTVTTRRALDEYRKLHRDRHDDGADLAEHGVDDDFAGRLDDAAKLRAFIEGLRDRLSERECQAATLCYLQGLTRAEAATALDVEPKRLEKIMDSVSRKVGEFVHAIEAGLWCDERGSLMRAFAFGILDLEGRRYALARDHLEACAGCRSYVRSLRGLGALMPPVGLPRHDLPEAGGLLDQLLGRLAEAKEALLGGGSGAELTAGGGVASIGVGAKLTAGAGAATTGLGAKLTAGCAAAAVAGGALGLGVAAIGGGEAPAGRERAAAVSAPRVERPERGPATSPSPRKRAQPKPARAKPKPRRKARRTVRSDVARPSPTPAPTPAPVATPVPAAAAAPPPPAATRPPSPAPAGPAPAGGEFTFEG
jgi:DNA-directed RNA polymerase specialized sigma24 family protein